MREQEQPLIKELGALREWHRELAQGVRGRDDRDALWLAACYEAQALDALRAGCDRSADDLMRRAAEVIIGGTIDAAVR